MVVAMKGNGERIIAQVDNMLLKETVVGKLLKKTKIYELEMNLGKSKASLKMTKDELMELMRMLADGRSFSIHGKLYDVEFQKTKDGFLMLYKENGQIKQLFIPVKLNYKHMSGLLRLLIRAYRKLF